MPFLRPISDRYFEDYIEGDVHCFGTIAVEADEIVDFANRFDPQTLHTDPEAAKSGPFGGLIASGWHTAGLMTRLFVDHYLTKVASLGSPGGDELRWVKPVRPGDTLSVRVTVLKAVPSKSKPDRGAVTSLVEVINQAGEVVMTFKVVNIIAKRPTHAERKYDRDFLLSAEKRNQVIDLWEVEKYGKDCFGNPNHVHLYGMPPKEWYDRGVRILARTCLEAVKDPLGNKIGEDIAEVVARVSHKRPIGVIDPFAGSCNGLYAILRHLPGAKGIGFEVEPVVFDLTKRNIAHLNAPIELVQGNYKNLITAKKHSANHRLIVFLAPPWGNALQPVTGLHLDCTKPPILEIVRDFEQVYGSQPCCTSPKSTR